MLFRKKTARAKGDEEMKLILASASPRRQELLKNLGILFEVKISDGPEDLNVTLPPYKLVETLALLKAENVAERVKQSLIIGADTIVVLDGKILGKPSSKEEAKEMLRSLGGKEHLVFSGIALVDGETGEKQTAHEITSVWFKQLTEEEIDDYLSSGESLDKAGGYGIQGKGGLLIQKIEGCYFNVVGLPIHRLYLLLKEKGINLLS